MNSLPQEIIDNHPRSSRPISKGLFVDEGFGAHNMLVALAGTPTGILRLVIPLPARTETRDMQVRSLVHCDKIVEMRKGRYLTEIVTLGQR